MASGTRVYVEGDSVAFIVAGPADLVANRIDESYRDAQGSAFVTFPSLELEGRTPRTLYIARRSISGVAPMLPGEVREWLSDIDEEDYDDA